MVRTLVLRKNTLATLSTVYYAKVGTAKVPKKANPKRYPQTLSTTLHSDTTHVARNVISFFPYYIFEVRLHSFNVSLTGR